ncbi:MAG: L-fucose mutarotase [Verrucomicrobiales bacterium]|nr:L-fucose mutarotase [Verrucomicrobiales bacterium]
MLIGISPLISPELLKTLSLMGHGDEIVFADAHFPAESLDPKCIRADGLKISALLEAILPLFALDDFVTSPATMMATVEGDETNHNIENEYSKIIQKHHTKGLKIGKLERFSFYERSRSAFVIIASGDTEKYANLILKKGVTPCSAQN